MTAGRPIRKVHPDKKLNEVRHVRTRGMVIQDDIKDALDSGRDELVAVLATNGVLPTVVEDSGGSDLLGSSSPTFRIETDDGTSVADRQTRSRVVDALELRTEADCEAVCQEIRKHDAWEE